MDPLQPPTTTYPGPVRGHHSRPSTRGNSPRDVVDLYHATPPSSQSLTEEGLSMASIEPYSENTNGHTAVNEVVELTDVADAFVVVEEETLKKRKRKSGTPSSSNSSPRLDGFWVRETDEELHTTHTSTAVARANSIREIMDLDAPLSTASTSQQEHLDSEDDLAFGSPTSPILVASRVRTLSSTDTPAVPRPKAEPLSSYNCPICFSPPTFATLTPCGHICCAECLFSAVRSTIERAALLGPAAQQAR